MCERDGEREEEKWNKIWRDALLFVAMIRGNNVFILFSCLVTFKISSVASDFSWILIYKLFDVGPHLTEIQMKDSDLGLDGCQRSVQEEFYRMES